MDASNRSATKNGITRRDARSKSPKRRQEKGDGKEVRRKSKSPVRRQRSFSPMRIFQRGGDTEPSDAGHNSMQNVPGHPNRGRKGLHSVPEAYYEGSSDSFHFTQSAAFKQEQMIQAFAMTSLADQEDLHISQNSKQMMQHPSEQSSSAFSSHGASQLSSGFSSQFSSASDSALIDEHQLENQNIDVDVEVPLRSENKVKKHNSLDNLQHLPEYYGSSSGSIANNSKVSNAVSGSTRRSATSSTIDGAASNVSRLSFNSMTSYNSSSSMPSLSSIMEHDLASVGNHTAHSETSSIATNHSSHAANADASSSSGTPNSQKKMPARKTIIPILTRPLSAQAASLGITEPRTDDDELLAHNFQQLGHLEGETLDYFGPKFNKEQKEAQQRWESENASKTSRVAKETPGNSVVAPLTHAQKQLLPPRQDVQPNAVPRRDTRSSTSSLQQQHLQDQRMQLRSTFGNLMEYAPPPVGAASQIPDGKVGRDTVPVVARRLSSSSDFPSPGTGSRLSIASDISSLLADDESMRKQRVGHPTETFDVTPTLPM